MKEDLQRFAQVEAPSCSPRRPRKLSLGPEKEWIYAEKELSEYAVPTMEGYYCISTHDRKGWMFLNEFLVRLEEPVLTWTEPGKLPH